MPKDREPSAPPGVSLPVIAGIGMENLEDHLARLGYRREAHDQECWQVSQADAPERKRSRRRRSTPQLTGRGRNLYMWILQPSLGRTEPYRVTRLTD